MYREKKDPHPNPFVYDRPLEKTDRFVGRQQVLSRIHSSFQDGSARRPLVLSGMAGIGRTSTIRKLASSKSPHSLITAHINTPGLIGDDIRDFLWRISEAIDDGVRDTGLQLPDLQKRMLVLRPIQVFRKRYWAPLDEVLGGRRLLLAFDDADVLAYGLAGDSLESDILDIMHELFKNSSRIEFLFGLTGYAVSDSTGWLDFFEELRSVNIPKFEFDQSAELMRQASPFHILGDVGRYIHILTGGHPGDLQRLCHALYERCILLGISHVTMADVAVTLALSLSPGEFYTPVYDRQAMIKHDAAGVQVS